MANRNEINQKYKWSLDSIVKNGEWENLFNHLNTNIATLSKYATQLKDKDILLQCLIEESNLSIKLENLYVYAKMKQDEDTNNATSQSMVGRIKTLSTKISEATSFIAPEITNSYTRKQLLELAATEKFCDYSYFLKELARNMKRVLSKKEERLIALTGNITQGFQNVFTMFDNADVKFDDVIDEEKNIVKMSHGNYSVLLSASDRRVRKDAYVSMFKAYKDMINVLTAVYGGNLLKDIFYAKIRGYKNCLESAMDSENVDKIVYENLIKSAKSGLGDVQKYLKYREQKLGVENLAMYDLHVPLIKDANLKLSYEDAYEVVCNALSVLGDGYVQLLRRAQTESWIDVHESKGKRSGAYSWGTYTSHPYVLLNYKQTTHDVFTIAHELGHAIHSYKSNAAQPYPKAGYEIFVAEVASTVNEMLLLRYLLQKSDGVQKEYLLSYMMDMFRTTFFRQTMFAEFEVESHKLMEDVGACTPEDLCNIYSDLNKKYYGKEITDELISYEWARIPHFYNSFYVYKYATGIVSAAAISEDIFNNKEGAKEKYMEFLSAGGSMPPVEILKIAGVDLTCMEPFEKAMKLFGETVSLLEKL